MGRLGRVYARDLSSRIAQTRLVAVADTNEALAREVAAEFDVPRSYGNPAKMIEDPAVDSIVIVSPTHTHRDLVVAALKAKKPTFCEKPPALSLARLPRGTKLSHREAEQGGVIQALGISGRFSFSTRAARVQ